MNHLLRSEKKIRKISMYSFKSLILKVVKKNFFAALIRNSRYLIIAIKEIDTKAGNGQPMVVSINQSINIFNAVSTLS